MDLEKLPVNARLTAILAEHVRRAGRLKLFSYYPDKGALRRELYPKHQEFLAAGADHRVRMMMAANRVGKTEGCGLYETALHMTGRYPPWWRGKTFTRPVKVWVCGESNKAVRESLQVKLLGPWNHFGEGTIPGNDLVKHTSKSGVPETVDTFTVRHASGGTSTGVFKSYEQGAEEFASSEQDVILLDEECSLEIYAECVIRTMTTGGVIMLTFTPLKGTTKLIKQMRESGAWEINATWDDVPHLSDEAKEELWQATPPHMREARAKGIPSRGSGVVFPVSIDSITCDTPPKMPSAWAAIGGLDFGWAHPSAASKVVHDRDRDIVYVVGAHRQREATPLMFAAGVRGWGDWLPWAWPHDGLQHDKGSGKQLAQLYREEGLNLLPNPASFSDDKLEHGVEAGIMWMLDRMQSGRFFVLDHPNLTEWRSEFSDYYRDEGIIVKERDDLMDATRVACMMLRHARCKPRSGRGVAATPPNWRLL